MTDKRGFFTIDAFFAFMLLVIVSGMLLNLANTQSEVGEKLSRNLQGDMVVEKLAAAINSAYANGSASKDENFKLQIELPEIFGVDNYSISFHPQRREISINNLPGVPEKGVSASVVPDNVRILADIFPENVEVYLKDNAVVVKIV